MKGRRLPVPQKEWIMPGAGVALSLHPKGAAAIPPPEGSRKIIREAAQNRQKAFTRWQPVAVR